MNKPLMHNTFDSQLSDALPSVRHLTEVDTVIIGSRIMDSEASPRSFGFHGVLAAGLQPFVLQVPRCRDRLLGNLTLQHRHVALPHLNIL